jgi:hypothetical protein
LVGQIKLHQEERRVQFIESIIKLCGVQHWHDCLRCIHAIELWHGLDIEEADSEAKLFIGGELLTELAVSDQTVNLDIDVIKGQRVIWQHVKVVWDLISRAGLPIQQIASLCIICKLLYINIASGILILMFIFIIFNLH